MDSFFDKDNPDRSEEGKRIIRDIDTRSGRFSGSVRNESNVPQALGDNESVIISDRGVEKGVLEGNTLRVTGPDMTPDSRREVATAMLERLFDLRMEHVRLFLATPFDSQAALRAAQEYATLFNEVLELMGVDS